MSPVLKSDVHEQYRGSFAKRAAAIVRAAANWRDAKLLAELSADRRVIVRFLASTGVCR